jgi:TolA-binding protein
MATFAEGYRLFKTSPKGPDNLPKLGITLGLLDRYADGCAAFSLFERDYPRATDLQKQRVSQERRNTPLLLIDSS